MNEYVSDHRLTPLEGSVATRRRSGPWSRRDQTDTTDVTWNALRLATTLTDQGQRVRLFLMNDAVDLAREVCGPPGGYDQDLSAMLKALIARGVPVQVCGTCMVRCGLYKNHPYFEAAQSSTMAALAQWVAGSDRVLTF